MSVPFSINRRVVGKPVDDNEAMSTSAYGWENRACGTDRKLIDLYSMKVGCMFTMCSFKDDYRACNNIKEIGGIGLDFDDGMVWQDAQIDPILGSAWLCYPSPSFTPDKPWKFRLIWRFPEPVTDQEFVRSILLKCMDLWTADPKCKDPARLWYGNPGSEPLFANRQGFVPVDDINEAWDNWAHFNPEGGHFRHRQERLNRVPSAASPHQYCPVIDGHYRDDVAVAKQLLKLIPPWGGSGSSTYQCADPVMCGLGAWLGQELALQLMYDAQWIWHDAKGPMDQVMDQRLQGFDDGNPFGVWVWMLDELVLHGGISQQQRSDFLQFKRREERGIA